MAHRKVEHGVNQAWELKRYVWRGKGERSALTGKQVRPLVAMDSTGLYHAGLRNWSFYSNGKPGEALYHHASSATRGEAIGKAQEMCREWLAAHRELRSDIARSARFACRPTSAAERYGGMRPSVKSPGRSLHR